MLAKRSMLARLLVLVVASCAILAAPQPAVAKTTPDAQAYVKYYVVAKEYQGQPENLTTIARRFLGSGERSTEIYQLNTGRVQPDGARLTDPAKLSAGWHLVLPWDAAGEGVQYGQIPSASPKPSPRPSRSPTPRPEPAPSSPAPSSPTPTPSSPKPSPSPSGDDDGSEKCTATSGSSSRSDWAQLRMAAESAWSQTRGNGVKVAVVDSGVDASVQQLSGRVAVGADVTVGNGRGDTDCLGTGTAMAGIIAADSSGENTSDDPPVGVAPDATILPVRMVRTTGKARPADAANAIEVAVSAGASVVALGEHVDLTDPTVAASVTTALNHDVLVVAGAPTKPFTAPSPSERSGTGALLLTGGVGAGDQLADEYQEGMVEVVAPGVDVASVAVGGDRVQSNTGTQYAVAFVAGQAALVRAAYPDLTADKVKQRIVSTADAMGGQAPNAQFGAGMINPASSVTRTLADGNQVANEQESGGSALAIFAILLVIALVIGAGVVLMLRMRRRGYAG
ncbi:MULTISPECIES: S8 family serine peptidase [Micromonospora]|uniref:Subtilase family protein n=1 Tax=Micromonospora yangpuensis TaxID=683228 RepID=A0A1C6V3F1_9ACTN|nr:S8 family serine peptidase [Micromonospora yangpuensis]GGM14807.1 hypothetical protein GCM10012279_36220 [Micromonospora yangpuensis]SCL60765.1 Subtilase family protein [Micromonospora yangpuensis]